MQEARTVGLDRLEPARAELLAAGLATVVVARAARGMNVSVCTFLVDTHCLGVKSVIGPRTMGRDRLGSFTRQVFAEYGAPPLEAPLELAQHLVLGAVDFARRLGFEPPADFAGCAGHLGSWSGPCAIVFGRHGKPMYVSGPYDNPARVLRTLEDSVGPDGYGYILGLPA